MIETRNDIIQCRAELKQSITARIDETFPAYFFHWIGQGTGKLLGLKDPLPWTVSAILLGMLIFIPGLLVSLITGTLWSWDIRSWTLLGVYVFAYLAPIVSHVNVSYNLLPGIRDDIVDFIQSTEDLGKLQVWLDRFFSLRGWLGTMIIGGLCFGTMMPLYIWSLPGSYIDPGTVVMGYCVGMFFPLPFWVIFNVLTLPNQLSRCRFRLYELNPSRSEVVQRLIDVLNEYFYLVAVYVAVATVIVSIHPYVGIMLWVSLFLGWGPSVTQFFINQQAVKRIITNEKWRVLNSLQEQIRHLQRNDLSDASDGTFQRINQLMDLHDRISNTSNTLLNLNVMGSFLQQLLLPLLALVLGNIDSIIKMIFG